MDCRRLTPTLSALVPAAMLWALSACTAAGTIAVTNTLPFERTNEVVEVDINQLPREEFNIYDSVGRLVPYQISSDSTVLFQATVPANAQAVYTVKVEERIGSDSICYGRIFPERLDDLTWENDCSAYRAYGPALQRTGEKAYGYDVWTKSVPFPVIEKRYHLHINEGISFHEDHGEGLDIYAVGPTLGCGAPALADAEGKITYPYCWESVTILDNGPLRFKAVLRYPAVCINGDTVVEQRIISLDAGSYLNKSEVSYSGSGGTLRPLAGIVVHTANPEAYRLLPHAGAVIYEDPTQKPGQGQGVIYTAMISNDEATPSYIPLQEDVSDACGHVTLNGKLGRNSFTYYWGSAWSKGGITDMDRWQQYIERYRSIIDSPLSCQVLHDGK